MQLRGYQKELIDNIRQAIKGGVKSVVAVLGCGGGKSVIQADIAKRCTDKCNYVIYLVHRKELCEQIKNTFEAYGVDMDYCLVTSIQTFRRQKYMLFNPNLILIDEAHTNLHAYKAIFDKYDCVKIGFTATPVRLKEKGLGELFQKMIQSVSTQWLIDNKFLSPFKYYSVPLVNLDGVKTSCGDYDKVELQDIMENKILYTDSVNQWIKLGDNKKTMVYCTSVESSKQTAEEFKRHGINAIHLDGATNKTEREQIVKDFRSGKIKVLCNAMLFSEGYDDKEIECILLLRPTKSLALHTQQAMRGMRYKEGKISIIIDCVGNVYKFGLPTEEREWSLDIKFQKAQNEIKIKECKGCLATIEFYHKVCPFCGEELAQTSSEGGEYIEKQEINNDLVELDEDFSLSKLRLAEFKGNSWEEVEQFRRVKKYKFMWSIHYCLKNGIKIPSKYNAMMRRFNL